MVELGVVFEEAGRALWCAPLLSTCALATCALLRSSGDVMRRELLQAIADGSTVTALVWNGIRPSRGALRARRGRGGWIVDGTSGYVVDGESADQLLVCATVDDRLDLFSVSLVDVEPGAELTRRPLTTMDSTRRLAELTFQATRAELIATDVCEGLDHALDRAELLLAAEQLGGANRVLEMAVDYAKTRIQFGRPIGSFQAIKHKLAEMLISFRAQRFDAGLAFVSFRPGRGGLGLEQGLQSFVEQRFLDAGVPDSRMRNIIGLGMAAPTLHAHCTDQQLDLLRPLYSGEHIWCQLFSEPGAGSDLAGLATRAQDRGDHYLVNGQKVWTSLGHVARWALLLARTDPELPKHEGLTYFVLDMQAPGEDVRGLRQMTGESEFNEVFLTDVRVPKSAVIGQRGQGWRIAMTTLMNERVAAAGLPVAMGEGPIAEAVATYEQVSRAGTADMGDRDRLLQLWTKVEAARLMSARSSAGPLGSIVKLQLAETVRAVYEYCLDLGGPDALLIDHYTDARPDVVTALGGGGHPGKSYLRATANSIEGGTSEILKTVLAERVLGLPGDSNTDRKQPWSRIRRS
jgi:alkylation response protein AidB-like acyl-CoA dehydrogenase